MQCGELRILLVAAENVLAELYKAVFEEKGFEVKVVTSFAEVLPALAEEPFDIVIPTNFALDPGGIRDVVLSTRETYPLVGIVVVSGWWNISLEVPFGPVDAFFPAPVLPKVLVNTIKAIGKIPVLHDPSESLDNPVLPGMEALLDAKLDKCNCKGKIEDCYWCMGTGTIRNGYFPWEDIDACPNMIYQSSFPIGPQLAHRCPKCGRTPGMLRWVKFESPEVTWKLLCGRAGPLSVCDNCHIQVDFFCQVRN